MSDRDPRKDPIQWFFNASLLVLFAAVALIVAIDLLSRIWVWLVVAGLVIGAVVLGIAIWKSRRRPW
ncbi:hypothetical protein H0264_35600 [Nocardia huaxiensis]|uniref:Uncharacterized protein n=1 Tax=Nocardia huaxiensis TaxID=2755382 RepID=A0A7D6VAG1_9NOCA|nr:hypothetical protein [Nocardia huaxiensis]QLY30391.1 hypothetical protein H0264_35600 [Nocardia huaxiensis]